MVWLPPLSWKKALKRKTVQAKITNMTSTGTAHYILKNTKPTFPEHSILAGNSGKDSKPALLI